MAKSPLVERITKNVNGVLNFKEKKVELEGLGEIEMIELFDMFERFDGELVDIKIEFVKK